MFRQSSQHSVFGTFLIFHASNRVRNTKIIFIFANNHLEFHFACLLRVSFFHSLFLVLHSGQTFFFFFFSVANIIHLTNVRLKQMKNSVSRLNLIQCSKFKIALKTHNIKYATSNGSEIHFDSGVCHSHTELVNTIQFEEMKHFVSVEIENLLEQKKKSNHNTQFVQ